MSDEPNDNVIEANFERPNIGHFFETMDRAALIMKLFEREIVESPAVKRTPELEAAAQKTFEALFDFYQLAGSTYGDRAEIEDKVYGSSDECGRLTKYRTRCALDKDHSGPCANETQAEALCESTDTDPAWLDAQKKRL